MMAKYKISGLPVVDADNVLIGIITNRDVKYQENLDESGRDHDQRKPDHF
jgi:IMP dehydrogenase